MFFPKDIYSLRLVHQYIIANKIDYFVIGKGTNLVINDCHFNKIFINLKELNKISYLKNNKLLILSGCVSSKVSLKLAREGYSGAEFLSVIPGSIGGAVYMNAGAYGKQVEDIIDKVIVLDNLSNIKLIGKNECGFKYRNSIFKEKQMIILGTIIQLSKTTKDKPLEKIKYYVSNKRNNQPLNARSAGSAFLNPKEMKAWEVVDKLGFRGKVNGGAKVSEKHTNFLLNQNQASFNDIYDLMLEITLKAKEKYNIDLECEWEILK